MSNWRTFQRPGSDILKDLLTAIKAKIIQDENAEVMLELVEELMNYPGSVIEFCFDNYNRYAERMTRTIKQNGPTSIELMQKETIIELVDIIIEHFEDKTYIERLFRKPIHKWTPRARKEIIVFGKHEAHCPMCKQPSFKLSNWVDVHASAALQSFKDKYDYTCRNCYAGHVGRNSEEIGRLK